MRTVVLENIFLLFFQLASDCWLVEVTHPGIVTYTKRNIVKELVRFRFNSRRNHVQRERAERVSKWMSEIVKKTKSQRRRWRHQTSGNDIRKLILARLLCGSRSRFAIGITERFSPFWDSENIVKDEELWKKLFYPLMWPCSNGTWCQTNRIVSAFRPLCAVCDFRSVILETING